MKENDKASHEAGASSGSWNACFAPKRTDPLLSDQDAILMMTDLYNTAGSADEVLLSLPKDSPACRLFAAQLALYRGDIEFALATSEDLVSPDAESTGIACATTIGAYYLIAQCAMYLGDLQLWSDVRFRMASLKGNSKKDCEYIAFSVAVMDASLLDPDSLPAWFKSGSFGCLERKDYPAARVAFAIYLHSLCYRAMIEPSETRSPQGHFNTFVMVCELLISQTAVECVIVAEIPLRLLCAVGYHSLGQDEAAVVHIDRAIALALPDRLYSFLAEYSSMLDFLLDERLGVADKKAQSQVRALNKRFKKGWMSLHNAINHSTLFDNFTTREREVVKLAAFGLTNQEIATQLHISLRSVKQALETAMRKTCTKKRSELSKFV